VTRPARLALLLYGTASAAYVLDRLTKVWAERALAGEPPIEVIPGVLRLTYTTNSGGAFGLGQSAPWLFAGATILVSGVIIAASMRLGRRSLAVALGLVLGGALGNLTDRAVNGAGLSGRVTDFIDLRVWPVFNVADMAVVAGALLLALSTFRGSEARGVREPKGT
jgi:signal peptidase II